MRFSVPSALAALTRAANPPPALAELTLLQLTAPDAETAAIGSATAQAIGASHFARLLVRRRFLLMLLLLSHSGDGLMAVAAS
jgi:hypothetical protein